MTTYIIIATVSYLLGSIPFGYILVKLFLKQDIRATGSGNIGATNVGRTGHKGLAIATLALDAGKGFLAVALVALSMNHTIFLPRGPFSWEFPGTLYFAASWAAFWVILGHVFPIWLGFRGGKGVATGAGAFLAIAPKALLIALLVFAVVVAIFRYVSLGSIAAAATFPVAACFVSPMRYFLPRFFSPMLLVVLGPMIGSSLLIILKHHQNIRRLLSGTENRLGAKKAQERPA